MRRDRRERGRSTGGVAGRELFGDRITARRRSLRTDCADGERMDTDGRLSRRARLILGGASLFFALGLAIALAVHGRQVDIDVYLMGGAHASSRDLYSLRLPGSGLYFTYPPFAALLFVPLAQIPREGAQILWAFVDVAGLFWLLYASIRTLRPDLAGGRSGRWAVLLVTPAILLDPVLVNTYLGQLNVLIVALVVTDLGLGSGRIPRGVLTGIAAAVKLTPLIFIPFLLLTRQRRAACWALATFVACGAAGFVVTPHASWLFWTKDVFLPSRAGNLLFISDQNLKSAAMRIAHGPVPGSVLWAVTVGVGLFGLALSVWARRASSPMLGILVCATTGLIVSPITWSHHLVWAVPAILWFALGADRPAGGWRWPAAIAVFFWAGPIWWVPRHDQRGLHQKIWELILGDAFFWAMLAFLLGVALLLTWRRRLDRSGLKGLVKPAIALG